MSEKTERRKSRTELQGWIRLGLTILGVVVAASVAWAAIEVRHAEAVARITAVERQVEKLEAVPEALAEIRAEQRAQRHLLDRLDRTLTGMAKAK